MEQSGEPVFQIIGTGIARQLRDLPEFGGARGKPSIAAIAAATKAQSVALLDDECRMQERRAEQSEYETGILDRMPTNLADYCVASFI